VSGQEITFEVDGKAVNGYLALPSQSNAPGVIVLHAWWGLNSLFKSVCDRLAAEGFVAFAPDLYKGKVAKTIDEAKALMPEDEFQQIHPIVAAVPGFLRGRPEVRSEPFAVIGFSMGAAWALVLASEFPEDFDKVVLFYGTYEGMDFSKIRADILGHYADMDEWGQPLDVVNATEADMRIVGLDPTFHIYPNTKHWFFEEDRPEFDPQATEVAWNRTLEFLRK
jgi:carboxymethylenebutenolidase